MAPIVCRGFSCSAARSSCAQSFFAERLAGWSSEMGWVPRLVATSSALYGRFVFANRGDANHSDTAST